MKAMLLNGSPRKNGNTVTALEAIKEGMKRDNPDIDLHQINAAEVNLTGCINCDSCVENGGICVLNDGGADIIEEIYSADRIIFATPVYWWGITAQLKSIIDRMYSKGNQLREQKARKQIGIIAIGEDEVTGQQYDLISKQFKCICDYIGWDIVMDEAICAGGPWDLAQDTKRCNELKSFSWK